jgi:hypothetical protein
VSKFWRAEHHTYKRVWLFAPLGFGVPGFAIYVALGRSLGLALTFAVCITIFGGLAQSYRLWRRRGR